MSITLPNEIHESFKIKSTQLHRPMRDIIVDLVSSYVKTDDVKNEKRKGNISHE